MQWFATILACGAVKFRNIFCTLVNHRKSKSTQTVITTNVCDSKTDIRTFISMRFLKIVHALCVVLLKFRRGEILLKSSSLILIVGFLLKELRLCSLLVCIKLPNVAQFYCRNCTKLPHLRTYARADINRT